MAHGGASTLDQTHFRGRSDTVGLNATTAWKAAENVDWVQDTDENFRVRFVIQEGGGANVGNAIYSVRYRIMNGVTEVVGWTAVAATGAVHYEPTTQYADGDATTDILSGTGSFVAGDGLDDSNATGNINITQSNHTEIETCLEFDSGNANIVDGYNVELRVYKDGSALDAYTQVPSIEINIPPTETPKDTSDTLNVKTDPETVDAVTVVIDALADTLNVKTDPETVAALQVVIDALAETLNVKTDPETATTEQENSVSASDTLLPKTDPETVDTLAVVIDALAETLNIKTDPETVASLAAAVDAADSALVKTDPESIGALTVVIDALLESLLVKTDPETIAAFVAEFAVSDTLLPKTDPETVQEIGLEGVADSSLVKTDPETVVALSAAVDAADSALVKTDPETVNEIAVSGVVDSLLVLLSEGSTVTPEGGAEVSKSAVDSILVRTDEAAGEILLTGLVDSVLVKTDPETVAEIALATLADALAVLTSETSGVSSNVGASDSLNLLLEDGDKEIALATIADSLLVLLGSESDIELAFIGQVGKATVTIAAAHGAAMTIGAGGGSMSIASAHGAAMTIESTHGGTITIESESGAISIAPQE